MSSPIESLFGGGKSSSDSMMLPMMMMAMQKPMDTPTPPMQSPTGSPSAYKKQSGSPSFAGSAALPTQQQNLGGKTLLGQ
jgi:hypothetical protein